MTSSVWEGMIDLQAEFDARSVSALVDAVFGVVIDESGKRISPPLYSTPDSIPLVNQLYSEVLATLTPREEKIIRMLYGLGTDAHSQKAVAEHFKVSPARISQLKTKALRRLRYPSRSRKVREFLNEVLGGRAQPISPPPELIDVIEKLRTLTPELIDHLRRHEDDLIKVNPRVFEHLIAEFFASWGFDDVRLVGTNPRTSADIYVARILNPLGIEARFFVEVKRWKRKVGVEVINQVLGAMLSEKERFGWHAAMIVTVAGFTEFEKWDRQQLKLKGIELKDKSDLVKWLKNYRECPNGLWLPEPPTLV